MNDQTLSSSATVVKSSLPSPHTLPPPVLRLLSLSSPLIDALHTLIHLATWTRPHGGGTKSCLLLIGWTLLCLYGYPVIRYAPQLVILSVILGSAVPNILMPNRDAARRNGGTKASRLSAQTLTQGQTDALLQKLSDIIDVGSTLHANLVLPVWQALTWQHPSGHQVTLAVAVTSVTVGGLWTLCFADWPSAWATAHGYLPVNHLARQIRNVAGLVVLTFHEHVYEPFIKERVTSVAAKSPILMRGFHHSQAGFTALVPFLTSTGIAFPAAVPVTYFPPFPLFSLSLRHAVLFAGLVAFGWCSTFATLVRHALWKSAIVRRLARAALRGVSLGHLGNPAPSGLFSTSHEALGPHRTIAGATADAGRHSKGLKASSLSPARVNTVPYRFELYENQRWWVGLDWTAALLPQERPSWTDSSLSPVSPPSSFTLPSETVHWRPKPSKQNPNAWEKRTVRWRWEEDEWHVVVNVGGGLGLGAGETPRKKAGRRSSEATSASNDVATPSGSGSSTLFSGFASRNGPASPTSPRTSSTGGAFDMLSGAQGAGAVEEEFAEDFAQETDTSGWRYGDNAWEKMSNRSGMGKYTRRRKWVRRARMEEIVLEEQERPMEATVAAGGIAQEGTSPDETETKERRDETEVGQEQAHEAAEKSAHHDDANEVTDAKPQPLSLPLTGDPKTPASKVDLKTRLANAAASPH
ncbi:unnamed protein product [Parajaminaea phylloscopi]